MGSSEGPPRLLMDEPVWQFFGCAAHDLERYSMDSLIQARLIISQRNKLARQKAEGGTPPTPHEDEEDP